MRILTKGKFKFYTREDGAFDDAFCVNEIFDNDNTYRIKPKYFTGGVVVDLGANIGDFSVLASQYAPVFCYEPEPHNWQMLNLNIELNQDVLDHPITPINKGVGKKGSFTIKNNSGHSQVLENFEGESVCECIDLNEALKDFDSIDLLKFDIEGSEYDLFEQATNETMRKIKRFVGELHSWRWADKERHDKLLTKLNKYFDTERWGYLDSTIAGSTHLILGASMIGGNKKKSELAIGIKTFMREDSLIRELDSIDQFLPEYRIYIADDSEIGSKAGRYSELERGGHKILRLPFDIGLSAGRNALMDAIKEEFVLYCDDDYIFDEKNGIKETLEVLKKRKDVGMITGMVKCAGQETTFNLNEGDWEEVDGIKLRKTDRGLNFFIARTKIFKDCKWNEKYKINREHEDFFKRLKAKVYYCPILQVNHEGRIPAGEYAKYRNREF